MTKVAVPALDRVHAAIQGLGGTHALAVELKHPESVQKAEWLAAQGKDFFSVTTSMRSAMAVALNRAVHKAATTGKVVDALQAVADAAQQHLVRRLLSGGHDVRVKPNSPGWTAYKQRHGYPTTVGRYTGALALDVRTSKCSLRKVGT